MAVPYVIVADEAFGLMENLMRPYGGTLLSYDKKVFHYRLTLARRYIECTFGIMCNKWRILHRPLYVHIAFAENIVKAICVLHHYARMRDEDTLHTAALSGLIRANTGRAARAADVRAQFTSYFINEGRVEWQDRMSLCVVHLHPFVCDVGC
jgi:hypothetical protein